MCRVVSHFWIGFNGVVYRSSSGATASYSAAASTVAVRGNVPSFATAAHRVGNVAGIAVDRPMDAALTRGLGHLALTVDDLEATYQRLLTAGAATRMPPSQSPEPGVRIAFVADPEGNLIELLDRS